MKRKKQPAQQAVAITKKPGKLIHLHEVMKKKNQPAQQAVAITKKPGELISLS